jgi:hypothetical protein
MPVWIINGPSVASELRSVHFSTTDLVIGASPLNLITWNGGNHDRQTLA